MKTKICITLASIIILSQSALAGSCQTYYETKNISEIAAKDVTPIGRAMKNRKHDDKIYLACTETKEGQCSRISVVLEATSCATKEAPRFFDLNKNLNFIADKTLLARERMSERTRRELDLPKTSQNYLFFTWLTLYMGDGEGVFYVLVPVGIAADIVGAPIRGIIHASSAITQNVVMKKIGKVLAIDPAGVNMSPLKIKNKHFENFIISMDEASFR